MSVVFSCLQNCSGSKDDDFRNEGREFQHICPETAKAREANVTVLVRGKFIFGLCGVTVERSLAIQKVEGSNLGQSASR